MRNLFLTLTVILLMVSVPVISNESDSFDEGIDYRLIEPAQPTNDPSRVEVIEIFWYGCPHCYRFESTLGPWIEHVPEDVDFYRLPAVFNAKWELHARAYFVAEILDVVEKTHSGLFHVMHVKHEVLNDVDRLADFYVNYGVDKEQFKKTYSSFAVNTKVTRAKYMAQRYGVEGVPAVIVEGKYLITGPMAKSYANMLKITDYLVDLERARKEVK